MTDKTLEPKLEPENDILARDQVPAKFAGIDIHSAAESSPYAKLAIYGEPGAGKTRLAASSYEVEEMRPILYVDIEGGTKSFKDLYPDIDVIRVKTRTDKSGRAIKTAWEMLDNDLYPSLKNGGNYRTVVVDNMTEGYQLAMLDVMAKTVAEHPERDFDVPAQREYLKAAAQVRRWVRNMRDLDMNVIITFHLLEQTDDAGIVRRILPSLPGKLAAEIAGFFDELFHLYIKNEKDPNDDKKTLVVRKLQTAQVGKFLAKDRGGKLPLVVSDPTLAKIYQEVI